MSQIQVSMVIAAIASPSVLAVIGILLNQKGFDRLSDDIRHTNDRMDKLTQTVHTEVKDLLGMFGDYGQRIVRLEERNK